MIHFHNMGDFVVLLIILFLGFCISFSALIACFNNLFKRITTYHAGFTYKYIKSSFITIIILLIIASLSFQILTSFLSSTCRDKEGNFKDNILFTYTED